jgi:hypothetical protein
MLHIAMIVLETASSAIFSFIEHTTLFSHFWNGRQSVRRQLLKKKIIRALWSD